MATLSAIRDWTRQQTLIESDDFASDKLNAVINQGVREVGDLQPWPFLEATTEIIIEDGQASYALPADFNYLIAVYDSEEKLLPETTRHEAIAQYGNADTSKPKAWYFFAEQIVFTPAPDTTYIITVDYYKQPTLLTADSDVPGWHPAYHMVLAEYAAAKIWEREEDLEKSTYHRQLFELGLQRMRIHYRNRGEDDPFIVGATRSWSNYPWTWQRN